MMIITVTSVCFGLFIVLGIISILLLPCWGRRFSIFLFLSWLAFSAIFIGSVVIFVLYVHTPSAYGQIIYATMTTTLLAAALNWLRLYVLERDRGITFVKLVSMNVVKRRLLVLGGLIALCIVAFPLIGISLPILIIIIATAIDLVLVLYRRVHGLYGNNDLEFGEAVRYVITIQDKSHGGPRHFDRVFSVPKQKVEWLRRVPRWWLAR